MTIAFRNVGELATTVAQRKADVAAARSYPVGIVTPVRSGDEVDGIFKMHRSAQAQVKDNLKNLLLTNHGDRVVQYSYGANLRPLMLELTSQADFDSEAQHRIKRAVDRYMPFVNLVDFTSVISSASDLESLSRIVVKVRYDVPNLGVVGDSVDVVFFIGG